MLEVFTAIEIQISAFWDVTLCSDVVGSMVLWNVDTTTRCHNPEGREDDGSMVLWNVGILSQVHTLSQPRRSQLERPSFLRENNVGLLPSFPDVWTL